MKMTERTSIAVLTARSGVEVPANGLTLLSGEECWWLTGSITRCTSGRIGCFWSILGDITSEQDIRIECVTWNIGHRSKAGLPSIFAPNSPDGPDRPHVGVCGVCGVCRVCGVREVCGVRGV